MDIDTKMAIQNELISRLKSAWVLAETDVRCETGNEGLVLDVALHTGSFIFGGISINDSPAHRQVMRKYRIEHKTCKTFADIGDCVGWALALQERHCRSQAVRMVA